MIPLSGVVKRFANCIPLHVASRKWALQFHRRPMRFATAEHMRFYCLTQTLHWLGCSFVTPGGGARKTADTILRIHARPCPVCGQLFVANRRSITCSTTCANQRRRRPA